MPQFPKISKETLNSLKKGVDDYLLVPNEQGIYFAVFGLWEKFDEHKYVVFGGYNNIPVHAFGGETIDVPDCIFLEIGYIH